MSEFDVVMIDVRKHGLSGAGSADVGSLAADLAALFPWLELGGFASFQTNRLSCRRQ
jgi:alpha-beta hydrolase superfamily lysophospholipase